MFPQLPFPFYFIKLCRTLQHIYEGFSFLQLIFRHEQKEKDGGRSEGRCTQGHANKKKEKKKEGVFCLFHEWDVDFLCIKLKFK